jgi:hypothetical protein
MSSKLRTPVVSAFFVAVVIIVTYRTISGPPPVDPEIADAQKRLQLDHITLRRQHLQRNAELWFYGAAVALSAAVLSALIVASGVHRAQVKRAQVHVYEIGHSKIVVHERDLSLAWPIATGLMNAEKLAQLNGGLEHAFELYATMARVHNEQLKTILGHRTFPVTSLPAIAQSAETAAPIRTPTFRDLLNNGEIGRNQALVFGFLPDGQRRSGTWRDILSSAIGGQSGYGKTATLRGLIAQGVLQGISFWVLDYHYPHPESLLATLGALKDACGMTYAQYDIDVPGILDDVHQTIQRRKRGAESSEPIRVLVIDEVLRIVKNYSRTGEQIEEIGTEGRKFGVYGLFSAQSWKADRVGGSTARDNLTSKFAHHMERRQADLLLQDSDYTRIVKKLRKGQVLFCPHNGEAEVLTIPYCAPADMDQVVQLMTSVTDPLPTVTGPRYQPVSTPDMDESRDVTSLLRLLHDPPVSLSQLAKETGINKGYLQQIRQGKPMSDNAKTRLLAWQAHQTAKIN